MKKFFFLLIFIIGLSQIAWSQKKVWPTAGLHQHLNLKRVNFRLSASPSIGVQSNRHRLSAGPIVHLRDFPSAEEKSFSARGLQTTYQFTTSSNRDHLFLFFVELSSRFQTFSEEWISNSWNKELQKYQDIRAGSKERLWENAVGFGLSSQLKEKLRFQTKLSVGYFLSAVKPGEETPSPIYEAAPHDYRFYGDRGIGFSFGIGVLYQFK